jgi:DNA replication initiation complex subunit (GINS family)
MDTASKVGDRSPALHSHAKYMSRTECSSPVTPKKLTTKRREEDEKMRDENRQDGREICATFNESSADTC